MEYMVIREFLKNLKKKFSRKDDETMKVAELKKVEQRNRIMKKFVQDFKRVARESRYKGRLLIKKFKREINRVIQRKLMEAEHSFRSIEQ